MSESSRADGDVRPRGRPRRAAARDAIIEATPELVAERGFQAATMDAIAARAGVGEHDLPTMVLEGGAGRRDYTDVPPTRGVYRWTAAEDLEVSVVIREL